MKVLQVRVRQDLPAQFEPGDDRALVGLGREIIRVDRRRIERVGAAQFDLAAAFRPQLIGDHRKTRPGMQPVLRPVGAERRDRAFDVGRGEFGARAREQRRRRADHRQRAAVKHVIFEAGLELARIAQHHVVDRYRQPGFELDRRRVMVLQALPDPGQMVHDRDTEFAECAAPARSRTASAIAAS